jgi:hypothetical protein
MLLGYMGSGFQYATKRFSFWNFSAEEYQAKVINKITGYAPPKNLYYHPELDDGGYPFNRMLLLPTEEDKRLIKSLPNPCIPGVISIDEAGVGHLPRQDYYGTSSMAEWTATSYIIGNDLSVQLDGKIYTFTQAEKYNYTNGLFNWLTPKERANYLDLINQSTKHAQKERTTELSPDTILHYSGSDGSKLIVYVDYKEMSFSKNSFANSVEKVYSRYSGLYRKGPVTIMRMPFFDFSPMTNEERSQAERTLQEVVIEKQKQPFCFVDNNGRRVYSCSRADSVGHFQKIVEELKGDSTHRGLVREAYFKNKVEADRLGQIVEGSASDNSPAYARSLFYNNYYLAHKLEENVKAVLRRNGVI